ncbi:MAG: diaminopimelate epimerase, partial [Myxococcota bacterium]
MRGLRRISSRDFAAGGPSGYTFGDCVVNFIKYQGLGNDFIMLTADGAAKELTAALAVQLCQRGHSIGGDGVMVAVPATDDDDASWVMLLLNSDGSTPEMCGNGIRCFVKHVVEALGATENPLRVRTPGGVRACAWQRDAEDAVIAVRVDMGSPSFERAIVPMTGSGLAHHVSVAVRDTTFNATGVNTGNPHMVVFGDASRETALRWGPTLTAHPMWPEGANVEFAHVQSRDAIDVTVWERGCGLTQACGTGATATAAAAIARGMADFDTPIAVKLPGGTLTITIEADFARAWMEG